MTSVDAQSDALLDVQAVSGLKFNILFSFSYIELYYITF